MFTIWKWIKNNPNRFMFLIPIILVAIISISHVVTWYDMANPIMWAVYLSVAIEIAAMTALVAASNRITSGIWLMFGLVTFIQVIGNVFYSFKEINESGELFKSWVELTGPVWELMGTEITDIVSLKRWLAFLTGGLLPVISLTSLHFFISFDKEEEDSEGYFDSRNEEIEKIVMSKPKDKEFNTPYPFTEEMKKAYRKAQREKAKDKEVIEKEDSSIENNHSDTTTPTPDVEEESKAESVKATTLPTDGEEINIDDLKLDDYEPPTEIENDDESKEIEEVKEKEEEMNEKFQKEMEIEEGRKLIEKEKQEKIDTQKRKDKEKERLEEEAKAASEEAIRKAAAIKRAEELIKIEEKKKLKP